MVGGVANHHLEMWDLAGKIKLEGLNHQQTNFKVSSQYDRKWMS